MKSNTIKKNRGITLIALIITIIVMLILVSVTISMAVNGGLFDYAGKAARETKNAINAENELAKGRIQIGGVWYDSIGDYLENKPSSNQGETEGEDEVNAVGVVDNENTITLASNLPNDTYTLKYENKNGPLANYKEICTLTATAESTTRVYDDLIAENCAPVEATIIGVYNSTNERVGDIELGHLATNLGNKLYSFGALADIHIGASGADAKVQNALTYLTQTENVDFTCIPGDLTENPSSDTITALKSLIDTYSAGKPVYMSYGNHDSDNSYNNTTGSTVSNIFENVTGTPLYYSFTKGNDVFIMVGLKGESFERPGHIFTEEELQWLYETLEANKNKRCFVFQHVFPDGGSGNAGNLYDVDIWDKKDKLVFESLMERYSNAIFFHGHSHIIFEGQTIEDMANYDNVRGSHSVHIPSTSKARALNGEINNSLSQGYVIDVYNNSIVMRGIDFVNGKNLPIACYRLDTTTKNLNSNILTLACDIEMQVGVKIDKNTGTDGTGTSYAASQHFVISPNIEYTLFVDTAWGSGGVACYYDKNGNYLGWLDLYTIMDESKPEYVPGNYTYPKTIQVPYMEGAASFRLRQWIAQASQVELLSLVKTLVVE